eukprot:GEMP01023786.1.p1 GENE.GEMP01023786.1~~GEMP01023786.1.p1  ORF type:complete len:540 (+),score=108.66 GEMP01023786.1:88-1707(+)
MYPSLTPDDRPLGDDIETPMADGNATQENPVPFGRNPDAGPNPFLEKAAAPSYWDLPRTEKFKIALRFQAITIGLVIISLYFFKVTEAWNILNIISDTLMSERGHGFDVPPLGMLFAHEALGTVIALLTWSLIIVCGYRGMTKRSTWRMAFFNCCSCCGIFNAVFGIIFCSLALVIFPVWVELAAKCDAHDICVPDGKIAPQQMNETMACIDGSHPNHAGMVMPRQCKDLSHVFMKCPWDYHHHHHHYDRNHIHENMRLNYERHDESVSEDMSRYHHGHGSETRIARMFLHGSLAFPPPPPPMGAPPPPPMGPLPPPPMKDFDGRFFYDAPPSPIMGHGPCTRSVSFTFIHPIHLVHIAMDPFHMHHHQGHVHKAWHHMKMSRPEPEEMEDIIPTGDAVDFDVASKQLPDTVLEKPKAVDYIEGRVLQERNEPQPSEYYCKVNVEAVNDFHIYVVAQPRLAEHVYLNLWVYLTAYCAILFALSFGFYNGMHLRQNMKNDARMLSLATNNASGGEEHAMYPVNEASRAVPLLTGQQTCIV